MHKMIFGTLRFNSKYGSIQLLFDVVFSYKNFVSSNNYLPKKWENIFHYVVTLCSHYEHFCLLSNNFVCPKSADLLFATQKYFMVTLRQRNICEFQSNVSLM